MLRGAMGPAAACVTVNGCPAMVSVPERWVLPEWAATAYATTPPPDPLAPDVIVIQPAWLTAAQEQPAAAVTETVPVVAAAGTDALVGDKAYEQLLPGACVTV